MSQRIENIKDTLTVLSSGDGLMEMLMEFERTLSNVDMFAYRNWIDGELVQGPEIDRYWFTTTWMYPEKRMPDPDAALRLEKIGCKVSYKKDVFEKPTKILEPSDWEDPKTKKAKMEYHGVWLVTIRMPKKFVTEQLESFLDEIETDIDEQTTEIAQEFESPATSDTTDDFGDEFDTEGDL